MKFSIKNFFTFTEEILNGKLHFLGSVSNVSNIINDIKLMNIKLMKSITNNIIYYSSVPNKQW